VGRLVKEKAILTPTGSSVGETLVWATALLRSASVDTARLDAECLLASLLGCERLDLYAATEERLPLPVLEGYRALVARRQAREPLAYLTGTKEFWSLSHNRGGGPEVPLYPPEEAGPIPEMAGSHLLFHLQKQGIAVAVEADLSDPLHVP